MGRWLALKRYVCVGVNEGSSDGNKSEVRGSVSNLDGACTGRAGEDSGINDCSGVLDRGDGWKCRLGALYLGGGVTVGGWHLWFVDGTGIA